MAQCLITMAGARREPSCYAVVAEIARAPAALIGRSWGITQLHARGSLIVTA
jgi:hypothetical protein